MVVHAKVNYIHGLQPAYRTELVIRRTDMLCGGQLGTFTPVKNHAEPIFGILPDHMHWPTDAPAVELADEDYQVALTWIRTDETPAHVSWVIRNNNPDGPIEWVSDSRGLPRR